jgi:hypothetical protein
VQTEGISVNLQIFPRAYSQKVSIPFVCFGSVLYNAYKITEKSKNCKTNFVVLLMTKSTPFEKLVYTFEL